jgi:hypothetical protein
MIAILDSNNHAVWDGPKHEPIDTNVDCSVKEEGDRERI